jgi:hypothetical protein
LRTQLALHIRFTEYKGIYNVRTGFVGKHGELTAKMRGSPQHCVYKNLKSENSQDYAQKPPTNVYAHEFGFSTA